MKLIHKELEKGGAGHVVLLPEEPEDMWHVYNLVMVGDRLRAPTVRRVQITSPTGSVDSQRVRTMLSIRVENVEFDPLACQIRVNGRNEEENPHVKLGAYHTIDLELNRKFSLQKEEWDIVSLDRIDVACNPARTADLAAVVMQEGLAHVCLVTPHMTTVRAKIEMSIPKKGRGSTSQHDKAIEKFFDQVIQAILRHVRFDVVKCVMVASPGFTAEDFLKYMFSEAIKNEIKVLTENRSKFVQVHASSGHKHALNEALADPAIAARLADTKAALEVKALEEFYTMLDAEPDRAHYGYNQVHRAAEMGAVATLLISDGLFRSNDIQERRKYVSLVESVQRSGGAVRLFSSAHFTGEQLERLSGVAAILRFPLPEVEAEDEAKPAES